MKRAIVALAAGLLAVSAAGRGERPQSSCTITVKAVVTGYTEVPVGATVPAPRGARSVELREAGDRRVPCDADLWDGRARLTWMLRDLPKGERREYRVIFHTTPPAAETPPAVSLEKGSGAVEIRVGGKLLTRYHFADVPKPFCYPVIGPTGEPVTRSFPMEPARLMAGESTDHPHHRSFWFGFGEVNGQDFWSESPGAGKIVHRSFDAVRSGAVMGVLRARSDWIAADGKKVCEEVRTLRVYRTEQGRLLDFSVTLRAPLAPGARPVKIGDTKEGMMAFRVASSMEVTRGQGHIETSAGLRDAEAWGKRADWCDYWGPVSDKVAGIAILEHPESFRHPTFWHVRDYGLLAANPFGERSFLGKSAPSGSYTIEPGKHITFSYRIYLHEGDTATAQVAARYEEYAHPPVVRVH
jgi:hypothetical protein